MFLDYFILFWSHLSMIGQHLVKLARSFSCFAHFLADFLFRNLFDNPLDFLLEILSVEQTDSWSRWTGS